MSVVIRWREHNMLLTCRWSECCLSQDMCMYGIALASCMILANFIFGVNVSRV